MSHQPTIHEKDGWQFKNTPDGVLYRHVNWEGTYWVTSTSLHAYTELCPLPADPPTLEFGGVEYTRDKLGCWSDDWGQVPSVHRMADFIITLQAALRPFAVLDIPDGDSGDMHWCLVGDVEIRRAAEALAKDTNDEG